MALSSDSYSKTDYTDFWFNGLLPLLQAHIYVENSLDHKSSYLMPDKMPKVESTFNEKLES